MDPLFSPLLTDYLDALVPARPAELRRMEALAEERAFPIIGPAAGNLCYLIARLSGARTIFELGSGFGYSTAWFARAVQENGGGEVHHTVWDEGLSQEARVHLASLQLDPWVRFQVGESVAALRAAEGPFDLIFLDIDKEGYPDALHVIMERLRPGGVLIADNLLWHGRIFDAGDDSSATVGVRDFTRQVTTDPRWSATLAPIRDGLLVARFEG